MYKLMKEFSGKLFANPMQSAWLMLLMLVNLIIPLFFLNRLEAQISLICMVLAFFVGMIIFKLQGFTRLLGLMHFPWFILVIFLLTRLPVIPLNSFFGIWIRVIIIFDCVSLIYDVIDVVKYCAGHREKTR